MRPTLMCFFFHETATTEIYTLSLHDALPIWRRSEAGAPAARRPEARARTLDARPQLDARSEEHTSELQSRVDLVCRLLLEKKKTRTSKRKVLRTFALITVPADHRRTPHAESP